MNEYLAWDVIRQLTFSRSMGFLDAELDQDELPSKTEKALDYFATIRQMSFLDH
jgi:hypothetical protein